MLFEVRFTALEIFEVNLSKVTLFIDWLSFWNAGITSSLGIKNVCEFDIEG